MRAKTGYRKSKQGIDLWDKRRKSYYWIGRFLHRYFALRTCRRDPNWTRSPKLDTSPSGK